MRRPAIALLGLILWGCTAPASLAPGREEPFGVSVSPAAPSDGGPEWRPEPAAGAAGPSGLGAGVIVSLSDAADAEAIARRAGASLRGEVRFSARHACLEWPSGQDVAAALASLSEDPGVTGVAPNRVFKPSYLAADARPNDPYLGDQWAHRATGMLSAWRSLGPGFKASNVAIAVLDSGCDRTHPEFGLRALAGQNYTSDHPDSRLGPTSDVTDQVGHGTHVAGIALGGGNDALGVAGVAWDARLLPVKVMGTNGGDAFAILQGIRYAVDFSTGAIRVRVINLSLGDDTTFTSDATFEDALRYAWNRGVIAVCAAGNASGPPTLPATVPHTLVVSSTSAYEVGGVLLSEFLSGFSNRGPRLDLAAPGGQICSCLPRNDNAASRTRNLLTRPIGDEATPIDPPYGFMSGTSMAAPYVSGVIALMAARYDPTHARRNASFSQAVVDRLKSTAKDLGAPGPDPLFGAGRIDPVAALAPTSL